MSKNSRAKSSRLSGPTLATGRGRIASRTKYPLGKYGAREREKLRLEAKHGLKVSGETHQNEHVYGFAALNKTSGQPRKKARTLENEAPGYMEVNAYHRDHVGTGSSKQIGPSGFSSETYRDAQRSLLESGEVSAAGQLNSLGYAFVKGFQKGSPTIGRKQARDSFEIMVGNLEELNYMQGTQKLSLSVSKEDRLELLAARFTAENQRYPSTAEIDQMRSILK